MMVLLASRAQMKESLGLPVLNIVTSLLFWALFAMDLHILPSFTQDMVAANFLVDE